ncbi:MAG: thioredoxin domain-containing protein [Phycisphaeraceae bacterium]|nr:thioredoxin domain-containing protein [Phycisphaeraceae bacterium]
MNEPTRGNADIASQPYRLTVGVMVVLAMAISLILLRHSLSQSGDSLPGCAPETLFDCDSVLASRWSTWLGMPVSAMAAGMDLLVLALLTRTGPRTRMDQRQLAWNLLAAAAMAILGAAVWFVGLQLLTDSAICPWCMAAHACGTLASILILFRAKQVQWRWMIPTAALAVAGLILPQWLMPPKEHSVELFNASQAATQPATTQPDEDQNTFFLGGRLKVPAAKLPRIGSPAAPHMLVYMFDYTCPHCRLLHTILEQMLVRYGEDQLAILLAPVPLDSGCNEEVEETEPRHAGGCRYAQLALAVWHADRRAFPAFNAYLFTGSRPPTIEEAHAKARELIGEAPLNQSLADGWPAQQIQRDVAAYRFIGAGVIPKLLSSTMLVAGRPGEPEELFQLLEDTLHLKPIAPAATTQPGQ